MVSGVTALGAAFPRVILRCPEPYFNELRRVDLFRVVGGICG